VNYAPFIPPYSQESREFKLKVDDGEVPEEAQGSGVTSVNEEEAAVVVVAEYEGIDGRVWHSTCTFGYSAEEDSSWSRDIEVGVKGRYGLWPSATAYQT
jgi:predicted component of type VI protein secretion system